MRVDGFPCSIRLGGAFVHHQRDGVGLALITAAPHDQHQRTAERLLDTYARRGDAFLNHLDVDCAFVLWDRGTGKVLLGRDATGLAPLFAHVSGELCRVASNIAALNRMGVTLTLDEHEVARWLGLAVGERSATLFQDVAPLVPGTLYAWRQGSLVACSQWRPDRIAQVRCRDPRDHEAGLVNVLQQAIERRVPPSGPVVTTLSGGLDSTSVTSVLAQLCAQRGQTLHAVTGVPRFSLPASQQFEDERHHAATVIHLYPETQHHLVSATDENFLEAMDRLSDAQGGPVWNFGNCGWFQQLASTCHDLGSAQFFVASAGNLTISRDGSSAISAYAQQRRLGQAAKLAWRAVRQRTMSPKTVLRQFAEPLTPFRAQLLARTALHKPLPPLALIDPAFARRHGVSPEHAQQQRRRYWQRTRVLHRLRFCDPGPISFALRQITGAGFTDPTADRELVEFCWSIPEEVFCSHGIRRSLIRNAMRGVVPNEILQETRRGRQDADIALHMRAIRPQLLEEVKQMKQVDLLRTAVDFNALDAIVSRDDAYHPGHANNALWYKAFHALSLGRFVRRRVQGLYP